jgi:hypothetical protein
MGAMAGDHGGHAHEGPGILLFLTLHSSRASIQGIIYERKTGVFVQNSPRLLGGSELFNFVRPGFCSRENRAIYRRDVPGDPFPAGSKVHNPTPLSLSLPVLSSTGLETGRKEFLPNGTLPADRYENCGRLQEPEKPTRYIPPEQSHC